MSCSYHKWGRSVSIEGQWWQHCLDYHCNAKQRVEVRVEVVRVLEVFEGD